MEDAGICPTLYMYQNVLPYIWRDNSMDYVTLMQEKISMTLPNLIIVCMKSMSFFFDLIISLNIFIILVKSIMSSLGTLAHFISCFEIS
jgi:hypothetical protein